MTIGEEVFIHGYIDEIRKDIAIIRNEGGYFGTVPEEIRSSSEIPNTCGDAISRQAVLDLIEHYNSDGLGSVFYGYEQGVKFADAVNKLPSVSPQQRPGRWIQKEEEGDAEPFIIWECGNCHKYQRKQTEYCPKCGSRMMMEVKEWLK